MGGYITVCYPSVFSNYYGEYRTSIIYDTVCITYYVCFYTMLCCAIL